jgi:hypothetical protein
VSRAVVTAKGGPYGWAMTSDKLSP